MIGYADTLFVDVPARISLRLEDGFVRQMRPQGFELSDDKYFVVKHGSDMHVYAEDDALYIMDTALRLRQKLSIPTKRKFRTVSVEISKRKIFLGTEEGIFVAYPKQRACRS